MGWPLTYFELACIIVVCFNGCLSFVILDDFCWGLLLARTFFIVFGGVVGNYDWLGVGSEVLWVWGGDRHGCVWIGDGHGCIWSGCVSGNIEPRVVCDWLAVVDAETASGGSTSIEVILHWTLLVIASRRVRVISSGGTSSFIFFTFSCTMSTLTTTYIHWCVDLDIIM
jgi:hypothetical protein